MLYETRNFLILLFFANDFVHDNYYYYIQHTTTYNTLLNALSSIIHHHHKGTIFARGNNDKGVIGVIPDTTGMCLSIARVFGEGSSSTSIAAINAGIEWCANEGSRVINLSLGGPHPSTASAQLYAALWEEGVLVVAAAGNDGNTEKLYPASYKNVLSVAAIHDNVTLAVFSQRNNAIDLAAPGVDVLSTVGGVTVTLFDSLVENATRINGKLMKFSPLITEVQDALELVDCQLGFETCVGVQGKACLIERGTTKYIEKATSCQAGGGILALIYNNDDSVFGGSLGNTAADAASITIPVLSLSQQDGRGLLEGSGILTIELIEFGYSALSGTSMAAPHVAGVAAKIWAARPACTNVQIQEALFNTARDLGEDGRDVRYGHGLVQGLDAYEYLLALNEPCGLVPLPSSAPSQAPTGVPSGSPSGTPSETPSVVPSDVPSEIPSPWPTSSFQPTNVPTNLRSAAAYSSRQLGASTTTTMLTSMMIGMISIMTFGFC
jgi:subtilisin family serine protease